MTRFTRRMARFVAEYQIDPNATQAAIRAGYSARWAGATATLLFAKPAVQAALAAAERDRFERLEGEAARVLREAARIAFADLRGLFDAEGRPRPITGIDPDTMAAVSVVESRDNNGRPARRIIARNKLAALSLLARHVLLIRGRAAPGGESLAEALARHRAKKNPSCKETS